MAVIGGSVARSALLTAWASADSAGWAKNSPTPISTPSDWRSLEATCATSNE